MEGNAALRRSCQRAVAVAKHAQRKTEHAVLDRLYYKNRSQHCRAPYFRRLEHVRRVLRRVAEHRVWSVLADFADVSKPLAFSSLTVSDLEDLVALLNLASSLAIPVAARSFVVELICRGHFVPFGVCIIALLARIYVIERQLCVEIAAALSSMRVLLAVQSNAGPAKRSGGSSKVLACDDLREDIGELVVVSSSRLESADEAANADALAIRRVADGIADHESKGERATAAIAPSVVEAPSLYDLMADEDPVVSTVVGGISGTFGSLASCSKPSLPFGMPPKAPPLPFGMPPKAPQLPVAEPPSAPAISPVVAPETHLEKTEDRAVANDEDIDDIFGDL